MVEHTEDSLKAIESLDTENISGLMAGSIKDNGDLISCMEKESLLGKMVFLHLMLSNR